MDFQIQFDASQHVGERCQKHPDGLTYQISEDGLCVTVRSLIENPAECEVAAFEYPARRGGQRGFSEGVHYLFGKEVFYKQATLYVPNVKGMVAAYKKKAAWKKFCSIVMSE